MIAANSTVQLQRIKGFFKDDEINEAVTMLQSRKLSICLVLIADTSKGFGILLCSEMATLSFRKEIQVVHLNHLPAKMRLVSCKSLRRIYRKSSPKLYKRFKKNLCSLARKLEGMNEYLIIPDVFRTSLT